MQSIFSISILFFLQNLQNHQSNANAKYLQISGSVRVMVTDGSPHAATPWPHVHIWSSTVWCLVPGYRATAFVIVQTV